VPGFLAPLQAAPARGERVRVVKSILVIRRHGFSRNLSFPLATTVSPRFDERIFRLIKRLSAQYERWIPSSRRGIPYRGSWISTKPGFFVGNNAIVLDIYERLLHRRRSLEITPQTEGGIEHHTVGVWRRIPCRPCGRAPAGKASEV